MTAVMKYRDPDTGEWVVAGTGPPGPQGPPGKDAQWAAMTQAQYDALPTKDPNTLYLIIG